MMRKLETADWQIAEKELKVEAQVATHPIICSIDSDSSADCRSQKRRFILACETKNTTAEEWSRSW
jgi:hypothetical protein